MATEMRTQAIKLLVELEFLLEKYSTVLRAIPQPFYLQKIKAYVPDYKYDPDEILARETHMDHVGSLPVVATTFYPYINDDSVDLGQSLIMLAIHDIDELITGDEMTFIKKPGSKVAERDAAFELLDRYYYDLYDDIDKQTTSSGKFAKALDKITPDIYDYLLPAENTIMRYKHFVGLEKPDEIVELFREKKGPFMAWNLFMAEFHDLLLERLAAKLKVQMKSEKKHPKPDRQTEKEDLPGLEIDNSI